MDYMHVLYLLSNLSYASKHETNRFLILYCLKIIYLESAVDKLVGEKKGCVLYAFVSFAGIWPHLHEYLQNFWVSLLLATGSPYLDPISEPMPIKLGPLGFIIMSPVLDLVARLWLLILILSSCRFCCQDMS